MSPLFDRLCIDGSKQGAYDEPTPSTRSTSMAVPNWLATRPCWRAAATLNTRVSWVYSLRGHNFLLTMLRLMQGERGELRVVDDQIGAPTWSRTIVQASALMLAKLPADPAARQGTERHLPPRSGGRTSWFGFATAIPRPPAAGLHPATDHHQRIPDTCTQTAEFIDECGTPRANASTAGRALVEDLALCLDTGI